MPIYEYRCNKCQRITSLYVRGFPSVNITEKPELTCSYCGATELSRIISRVAINKTDKDRYEGILNDAELVKGMEANDPRALAEWTKRLEGTTDLAPEYKEMMGKLERGEDYGKVITEMQDSELGAPESAPPEE